MRFLTTKLINISLHFTRQFSRFSVPQLHLIIKKIVLRSSHQAFPLSYGYVRRHVSSLRPCIIISPKSPPPRTHTLDKEGKRFARIPKFGNVVPMFVPRRGTRSLLFGARVKAWEGGSKTFEGGPRTVLFPFTTLATCFRDKQTENFLISFLTFTACDDHSTKK